MGAIKEAAWEFCEMVYPDNDHKVDELFSVLCCFSPSKETINPITIEEFRKFYERTGKWPHIGMDDLETMMKEGKRMTASARSNLTNIVIDAIEDIAAETSAVPHNGVTSEQKKIIAADALIAAIRQVVKEEMEHSVYV